MIRDKYMSLGFGTRVAVYIIATLLISIFSARVLECWCLNIIFAGFVNGLLLNFSSWLYIITFFILIYAIKYLRKLVVETATMKLNVSIGIICKVLYVILGVVSFIILLYNVITLFEYTGIFIAIMYGLMEGIGVAMIGEIFKSIGVLFGDIDAAVE